MEGIHTFKSLLQKGDWLVKIDLKDSYFSVPISKEHRKFLCFEFRDNFYQLNCLPFVLASAPWVFTKTFKLIAALGQELGIRFVVDIDDILMAETKEKARDQASGLIYLLQCLGFTVNMEKTVLDPSQCLKFSGFLVDTTKVELSLPAQKIKKIRWNPNSYWRQSLFAPSQD
uniref:Reverse transcriptase domain-containing protein n=1 Tax=Amphimedon queenslandica TaxID=400682 RepID=A0A1X7VNT7_AMPQE